MPVINLTFVHKEEVLCRQQV